jgi:hypothetical protein
VSRRRQRTNFLLNFRWCPCPLSPPSSKTIHLVPIGNGAVQKRAELTSERTFPLFTIGVNGAAAAVRQEGGRRRGRHGRQDDAAGALILETAADVVVSTPTLDDPAKRISPESLLLVLASTVVHVHSYTVLAAEGVGHVLRYVNSIVTNAARTNSNCTATTTTTTPLDSTVRASQLSSGEDTPSDSTSTTTTGRLPAEGTVQRTASVASADMEETWNKLWLLFLLLLCPCCLGIWWALGADGPALSCLDSVPFVLCFICADFLCSLFTPFVTPLSMMRVDLTPFCSTVTTLPAVRDGA